MGFKNKNKIDVIRDILRSYKAMQTVPQLDRVNRPEKGALSFMVFLLIELVGAAIVKQLIVKFLTKELGNSEKSMKDSLKSSTTSDSSTKGSSMPNYLKSNGSGIKIPLKKLDKEGVIRQDPNTQEGKDMLPDGSFEKHLQNTVNGPPGQTTYKNTITTEYNDSDETVTIKSHSSQDNKLFSNFINILIDGFVLISTRLVIKTIIDFIFGNLSSLRFTQRELVEKLKTDTIINKIKEEDNNPFNLSKGELNDIEDQSTKISKGINEIDLGCGKLPISFDNSELNGILSGTSLVEPQSIQVIDNMMDNLSNQVVKTANSKENEETIRQGFLRKFLEILEFILLRSAVIGPQSQLLFILIDVFKGNITLDGNNTIVDPSNTTTQDLNNRKGLIKNVVRQIKGILVKSVFSTFKKECDDLKNSIIPIYIKDVFTTYRKQLLSLFGIRDSGIIS